MTNRLVFDRAALLRLLATEFPDPADAPRLERIADALRETRAELDITAPTSIEVVTQPGVGGMAMWLMVGGDCLVRARQFNELVTTKRQ